jgi:UDP-glucose 4-epimerase
VSKNAETRTTTFDDGTFLRTAIVVDEAHVGSLDVVDKTGKRICQVNIFVGEESGSLIVDVIDVERRFANKRALAFAGHDRRDMEAFDTSSLISVDFRPRKEKGDDET